MCEIVRVFSACVLYHQYPVLLQVLYVFSRTGHQYPLLLLESTTLILIFVQQPLQTSRNPSASGQVHDNQTLIIRPESFVQIHLTVHKVQQKEGTDGTHQVRK